MAENELRSLDREINDYLLAASGHLAADRAGIDVRRVACYGAAAGSALAMMSQAEAAVVVHSNPPVTVAAPGGSATVFAPIDMNGDGIDDFRLFGNNLSTSAGLNGTPGGANNFAVALSGNLAKLASGNVVGATPPMGTWSPAPSTLLDVFFAQNNGAANWGGTNGETGFAGVRFNIGGQNHYGWIRLRVNTAGSLTALAWAYESCPNVPITAGATSGGGTCGVATAVPATGTPALALMGLALGGLGLAGLRRRRQAGTSVH